MFIMDFFLFLYPVDFIKGVIIPQTNKRLSCENIDFHGFQSLLVLGCIYFSLKEYLTRACGGLMQRLEMFEGTPARIDKCMLLQKFGEISGGQSI